MSFKVILQNIELADNTTNDNTFDVWFDERNNRFIAIENCKQGRCFKYALTDSIENIIKDHEYDILKYRLGRVTKDDEVTIGDIFMFRKFNKII